MLSNMYVKFGDQIHRQIQGTPMGNNCASHLANLYLMMYELRFYIRLATLYVNPAFAFLRTMIYTIARAFLLTARYIDDLASINNPYLHSLLFVDQHNYHSCITGIYPRTLRLLLLIQVFQSTTWTSQFSVSLAAAAKSRHSCTTSGNTPH